MQGRNIRDQDGEVHVHDEHVQTGLTERNEESAHHCIDWFPKPAKQCLERDDCGEHIEQPAESEVGAGEVRLVNGSKIVVRDHPEPWVVCVRLVRVVPGEEEESEVGQRRR